MSGANSIRLVCLAAIWGSSFLFMRVLSPEWGPIAAADLRVLIAGLSLLFYFRAVGFETQCRRFWKQYLVIGAINSALPFTLFSYAAIHLPASYEVILNSSSPFFGVLFSALWLGETLSFSKVIGLVIGAFGVAWVARAGIPVRDSQFHWAVMASLCAAASYGLAGVYIKRSAKGAPPQAIAGFSQLFAGFILLPFLPLSPPTGAATPMLIGVTLVFALVCSAVAYLLYYRLIQEVGATKALTVTFLMPVFGMIWGALFLGESITSTMVLGCSIILAGTCLVTNALSLNKARSSWESYRSNSTTVAPAPPRPAPPS